ncbi:hypothetical protein IFM89_025299 [Coptis chinensis]|uniref:Uncharacterized protein n=1 Tax=Coptis chinensis TaxID=261450 RepID=A0A835LF39_9MAGN|nr:hypothetical protein IFM89_025299 [Coptis chinensis]
MELNILFFFFFFFFTISNAVTQFSPTDNYLINLWFTHHLISLNNRFFITDTSKPGVVEIVFTPFNESSFGYVNAIEVFSAPDRLIADTAMLVGFNVSEKINGLRNQGLETVYRLNVGGPKVTPFNDTLWRTWIPDDGGFENE